MYYPATGSIAPMFLALIVLFLLFLAVKFFINTIKFIINLPSTVPKAVAKLNQSVEVEEERKVKYEAWEIKHQEEIKWWKENNYNDVPDYILSAENPYSLLAYYQRHPEKKLLG